MPQLYLNNIRPVIIEALQKSQQSIEVAVAWFNDKDIFDVLVNALKRGVSVKIILTNDPQINSLDWNLLGKLGGQVYVYGVEGVTMHHKFCLIDDTVLLSGTYNWTYRAHKANKENLQVFTIQELFIIHTYKSEFQELLSDSELITKPCQCYEVKEFMIDNGFNAVRNRVKRSVSGYLFIIFVTPQDKGKSIFFSAKASEHTTENQKIKRGFFKPFVIVVEEIEIGVEPIVTISLREEHYLHNALGKYQDII